MNRITRIAAVALAFTAAGSAFAETPEPAVLAPVPAVSTLSRADVQADVAAVTVGEADLNTVALPVSALSRAEVRAKTLAAIANGEIPTVSLDTNAFAVKPATPRLADSLHFALLTR